MCLNVVYLHLVALSEGVASVVLRVSSGYMSNLLVARVGLGCALLLLVLLAYNCTCPMGEFPCSPKNVLVHLHTLGVLVA